MKSTIGRTHVAKTCSCPTCKHPFDRASSVGHNEAPKTGDVSVCIECTAVNVFDEDGSLRPLTDVERFQLEQTPQWIHILRARDAINHLRHFP